ncbi:uncharacterized protein TNCT_567291 [Trichonephila clavata]|uniref:Uncharacterized protein n=1 Tax=Trichonephila clavata TaxID=2740835 RepID=A0A8X6FPM4_TRICU|nr:uncharacterized protein TNCT_567291 [Trichonephila clavata]
MYTQNMQQYQKFIQGFSTLFDEIKKEDDPIYNARVDFNTVKFLTEHVDWNWDEDENKNKAYEVILQECDKTARQELEDKAKEELNKYITNANNINDDVKDKKVSIYGNHASITLEDNKKEFKISEFLNSDFCQKNGISGFSTLHSDGKSGMHGFVAEEGGKKIRHYVVTDGSYEMTLKWYGEKGEEYKIKINIKADGVEFIEGNITEKDLKDELKMNKDVKIGGLFLHEIKFREKGKVNEVEHDGKDNQVLNKSSEIAIKSNSRDIEQEVKKPVQKHQATHMNREIGSQTPPLPPLRISSLPPKENVVNEQGRNASAKPVSQDSGQIDKQNNPTPNNQQKGATSDPSDGSTFTKSVSHNQDNRQRDERYDNPTFGHAVPGSRKPDRSEQIPNDQQQPKTQQQEGNSKGDLLQDIRNFKKNNLRHIDVDDRKASIAGSRKNNPSPLETLKDRIPYSPSPDPDMYNSDNQSASGAEWKEREQLFSVPKPNSKSDSGYSSPTHANHKQPQVNSGQLKASLMNVGQRDDTLLTEFTSKLDKETQKFPLKPVDQEEQTKEHLLATGLLKENAAETKINDSGYSSPTYTSHYNFQVSPEQLGKRLETIESKKEDTLEKLNKGLKEPSQQATKTKDLFLDSMLEKIKEGKQYDPVLKLLERKVAEQENDNTNLTIDKNSELYKLLEKDAAQLKVGAIEEERKDTLTEHTDSYDRNRIALGNRNKRPLDWAKRIAESQEKDTNKTIGSIIYSIVRSAAIGAMTPIVAPAKAAEPIPSIAPGKIAVAAAARPTPIAAALAAKAAITERFCGEFFNTLQYVINAANNTTGTAATIPPITKGDKAVKLNPKPVSAPVTDARPKSIKSPLPI